MDEESDNSQRQTTCRSSARTLRSSLSRYAYQPQARSTVEKADTTAGNSQASTVKRQNEATDCESPAGKRKKKRGYASPETYAHLGYLTDCLDMYLEVLFCGINPGVLSAKVGHHFAHPTNQFYKILHGAGLTDRLVAPTEDATLPKRYSIGITDLVDRPSASADELSGNEMIEAVPVLLEKLRQWKPHIVCFVGKGMWLNVEKGIKRIRKISEAEKEECNEYWSSSPRNRPTRQEKTKVQSRTALHDLPSNSGVDNEFRALGFGLQPYKMNHSSDTGIEASSPVLETLFFCVPSSSGLVTSMTRAKKIELFKLLKETADKHKARSLDTSWMQIVSI